MSAVAAASATCRLVLDCDLRWEETSGTGSEARKTLRSRRLWRDKQTARPEHDATTTKTSIPFSFDLPEDAKPSSLGSVNDGIRWLLEVTAELDGLDYVEQFRVPVVAPGVL